MGITAGEDNYEENVEYFAKKEGGLTETTSQMDFSEIGEKQIVAPHEKYKVEKCGIKP